MFPDLLRDIQAAVDDLGGKVSATVPSAVQRDWEHPVHSALCSAHTA